MIVFGCYFVIGGIFMVMDVIGLCGFYGFFRYKFLFI